MEEKRKHVRLDLPLKVNYKPLEREELEKDIDSLDISEGGLSIPLGRQLKPDEELGLRIALPEDSGNICAEGRIVWSREFPEKTIAGVEFTQISRFDRARLIRFIYAKKERLLLKSQAKEIFFLREILLQDKEELLQLVIGMAGEIEQGLKILDRDVQLDKETGPLDILARDATGQLVIIEISLGADEGILLPALKHLDWILRNGELLKRMYPREIDFLQRPRIYLIGKEFSDSFKRQLPHLKSVNLRVVEYRCFIAPEGKKGLWLDVFSDSRQLITSEELPQDKEQFPAVGPILDIPEVDEQRKRIIRWLWRKG